MRRCAAGAVLLVAVLAPLSGCNAGRETTAPAKEPVLRKRIERLVETFLTSEDEATKAAALSEARPR